MFRYDQSDIKEVASFTEFLWKKKKKVLRACKIKHGAAVPNPLFEKGTRQCQVKRYNMLHGQVQIKLFSWNTNMQKTPNTRLHQPKPKAQNIIYVFLCN